MSIPYPPQDGPSQALALAKPSAPTEPQKDPRTSGKAKLDPVSQVGPSAKRRLTARMSTGGLAPPRQQPPFLSEEETSTEEDDQSTEETEGDLELVDCDDSHPASEGETTC
jgi:hypothetical protein